MLDLPTLKAVKRNGLSPAKAKFTTDATERKFTQVQQIIARIQMQHIPVRCCTVRRGTARYTKVRRGVLPSLAGARHQCPPSPRITKSTPNHGVVETQTAAVQNSPDGKKVLTTIEVLFSTAV